MSPLDTLSMLAVLAAGCIMIGIIARTVVVWRTHRGGGPEAQVLEERLARLERTVEGLAVDTQRITDGQRFLTQLLADRESAAQVPRVRQG